MEKKLISLFVVYTFGFLITKSEKVIDGVDIDDYLTKYHYMGSDNPNPQIGSLMDTDPDEARRIGLAMYQMMWDMEVTGEADAATITMMKMKRCGIPDIENEEDMPNMNDMMGGDNGGKSRRRRYVLQGSKWPSNELTYRISQYTRDLAQSQVDRDIEAAFRLWAAVTPLSFTRVLPSEQADIDIRFAPRVHGDGFDFDGPGGTLAHAFYPQYGGDSHFDEAETWTIDTAEGINLFQVAAHEFGHALGLKHSTIREALMYPFYTGYIEDFTLPQDDINGIQAIYGRDVMPPMSTYRPTSYVPPTMPPGMPDVCADGRVDAITVQYINYRLYTIAFKGDHYMLLNDGGLVDGYPKMIAADWAGITSVDAALTREWEWLPDISQWKYKSVTYLFSGSLVYQFIERRLSPGYPKSITSEWGLPNNLDAVFQWSGNGRIYSIKGNVYYRHSRSGQNRPDTGYPRALSIWSREFTSIDAVFIGNDRMTYFFAGNRHYKFDDSSFSVAAGYPKDNRVEWFGCDAGGIQGGGEGGDGSATVSQTISLVLTMALVVLIC